MTAKIAATGDGTIIFSEGDIDLPYGIASLSKIWAAVLLHEHMRAQGAVDEMLRQQISVAVDYENAIYTRRQPRPDLMPPDDPLSYRPFRAEKKKFRLPVERHRVYTARDLYEAALFQSKNDAIQALTDHFFGDSDNGAFRKSSAALAHKIGLQKTIIADPHGLNDGDNITTAREWAQFCASFIASGHLDFFARFDPTGKEHTARALLDDARLGQQHIRVLLAKTGSGNNRQGNDGAESLMAIAATPRGLRIAVSLSDRDTCASVATLLAL